MAAVSAHAPAKVNLALHVTGRRPDGYHEIETLAVFTEFGDRVTASPDAEDAFEVAGPFSNQVPRDKTNLVPAALALLRAHGYRIGPVRLRLEKALPVASGVGGGSSDAAAALRALMQLAGDRAAGQDLASIALRLGADVPMCLAGRPLVARGIGERIRPVAGVPALALVLANPGTAVPTPAVFAGLERRDGSPLPAFGAWRANRELCTFLRATRNDLEQTALRIAPAIADTLAALARTGAMFQRMSGSGATCFGIYPSPDAAKRAADAIRRSQPGWFVADTLTTPSQGADHAD